MTKPVQSLLASFDRLSEDERFEAAEEVLGRTLGLDDPPLDDETLAGIAETSF